MGYVPKQAFVKTQYKLAGAAFSTRLRAIKDVGTLTKWHQSWILSLDFATLGQRPQNFVFLIQEEKVCGISLRG